MSDRKHLVLHSGGLDSTYMVQWLLTEVGDIDTFYVDSRQAPLKRFKEKIAIKETHAIFDEMKFRAKTLPYEIRSHRVIDIGIVASELDRANMSQPYMWLQAALKAAGGMGYTDIYIGYVLGDTVVPFLDKIKLAWKSLWEICYVDAQVPDLHFPLVNGNFSKKRVLTLINGVLLEKIWFCEHPLLINEDENYHSFEFPLHHRGEIIVKEDDRNSESAWARHEQEAAQEGKKVIACRDCIPCRTMRSTIREYNSLDKLGGSVASKITNDKARHEERMAETASKIIKARSPDVEAEVEGEGL